MYSSKGIKHINRGSVPHRSWWRKQFSTTISGEKTEKVELTQRELREKAIADALAREEEIAAKAKALYELRAKSRDLIDKLNKAPSDLIESRLQSLQRDLDSIANQSKVKQLDEELEEFMLSNMKLPQSEIANSPWASSSPESIKKSESESNENSAVQKEIKSTASNSFTNQFPNLKPTPDYKPYSDQELYLRQLAHSRLTGSLGSSLNNIYQPRNEVRNPTSICDTSISTLLAAGCHMGHAKAMWRPTTQPFIYGEYDGIHLIDLNETLSALKRACQVIKGVSEKGGIILFVGTSRHWEQHRALEEAASRCRGYYVSRRWIPGTITNFTEVTKQIGGEKVVEVDMSNTPTNRILLGELKERLVKPDLVVLLNPVENRNCINECIKLRVPTIGLCDTDMEPSLLTYPIPSNDDSMRVSSMMLGILSRSAEDGLRSRLKVIGEYQSSKGANSKMFSRKPSHDNRATF
ncbi:uncharacterized protein PRCAT00006200001 [Priceomyces carsonii]|uniref:uncharacterized protein n=1 Tax=Priceomyces carsonii TaxID=28549 RepID=UPI002ED8D9B5|nr:unnamed protein product [Priceomyces carsonii]